ncbi:hypothetical protein L211DRAFT_833651 [Terfezia boudieri ATCC MYA-4762]|uniref:Uncharacterized protein n=1 Tax=Terfezia boudieri ATCC MYA-4762 TaxID=1051890 RepID=A0A3N4M0V9_9PEZI|nr:hypothetical protein L211DRAFT_833651 [Terfezia boudieri ATCC MYA-4762]
MVWGCFWGNQRGTFVPVIGVGGLVAAEEEEEEEEEVYLEMSALIGNQTRHQAGDLIVARGLESLFVRIEVGC